MILFLLSPFFPARALVDLLAEWIADGPEVPEKPGTEGGFTKTITFVPLACFLLGGGLVKAPLGITAAACQEARPLEEAAARYV